MKCEFCGKDHTESLSNGEPIEFREIPQGNGEFYWVCLDCFEVIEEYDEYEPMNIKPKWHLYSLKEAKRLWKIIKPAYDRETLERMLSDLDKTSE
ncbi:hypothetical protein [Paenibacillus borealis]|uniref:Uncharacterized protein n=1 Tax=Paenibacillus borealis TaxID=160799 RepID=A0A089LHT8_PAEBO|nr:hypothetical protein [Paenibacillus borealis]AIQ59675.1 hypothetical protein PBOR_23995 [Paenibacillus borealis]